MNPFRRFLSRFRKAAMVGTPPSARPRWPDPSDHAVDFSQRWADRLEVYCGVRMEELGIPSNQIGSSDAERGVEWRTFFPDEREGGGVATGGRLSVDSGVLNPDQITEDYGEEAGRLWAKSRLRDRIDAIIIHEESEAAAGTHEGALELAPETTRRISDQSRRIFRAMEHGWRR